MGGDTAPKIDELIKNIPKDQLEILRKIWAYFLQNKEWSKGKRFRKEHGHLIVKKVVANHGPIFIWHMDKEDPSREYYKLTTEGVYAVEGVKGPSIKLLRFYLDYLRKKFDENPDFEKVTAQELRENLHMNSEDTQILGELLEMGNSRLWGRSASNLHSSDWEVGVIEDIETLYYEANSSQEFLFKKWNDHIEWIITHSPSKAPGILGLKESQISGSAMKFRPSDKKNSFEYDVFICHASEDKEPFVRSLAETLVSKELRVWYDDLTLSLGDSLRRSIDYGLAKSRYGVVVLSKDFFAKEWPQKELDALVARENGRDKVILPIWHGVTKEKVQSFSPILADRLAASTDKGMDYVVNEILTVVSPTETDKNKNTKDIKELEEAIKDRIREIKLKPIDSSLISAASQEMISEFYSGESPSPTRPSAWEVIAANGDVKRDQEEEIEHALQENDNFHIICIVAEPGAGKTTLAMRILYELSQREDYVFWLADRTEFNRQFWYQLYELAESIKTRIYVFIDDIFRDRVFVKALRDMNKGGLPVTIIATSRTNEYKDRGLKEFIRRVELKLSEKEKRDLLEQVGKSYVDLSPDEQEIFNETNLFLVLGMVLSKGEGKGFSEIIKDVVEGLKEKDEVLYRAFEYVCFSSNYDISIPEDLLINLDKQGRFYRLLENEAAKGIFYEDYIPSYTTRFVKVGHQLIAKEALRYYSRYPKVLFEEILDAADEENWMNRRYIAHLTRAILEEGQEISKEDVKDIITKSEKITHILQYASISELNLWQSIYRQLNLQEEANKCVEEILLHVPNTTLDCQLLISEFLYRGLVDEAFSTIREWLEEHTEDRLIFSRYLPLVKEKGSQEQIEEVIGETSLWLKEHSEDSTVRKAWLTLIRDKGTREQIEKVIEETRLWLKKHPEDHHVRVSYVPLVKEKGSQEQIEGVIEETDLWLKEHPEDYTVRASYVPLVKDKGSQEQIEGVIEETNLWLKEHPEDSMIRSAYFSLVKEKGNEEQIEEVIDETTRWWLQNHPDDNVFHEAWLVLIRDKGNQEQIRRGMEDTISWLKDHPEDNKIRSVYLSLVRNKGFFKEEDIKQALADTEQWMKKHGPHPLFQDYLPLVEKVIKTEIDVDIDIELVKQFGYEFINSSKWEYNIRPIRDFADWLRREEFFDEAEQIYEGLLKIKMRGLERSTIHFSYGKMFLGQAMNLEFTNAKHGEKLKRAEEKFREALKVHKGHHMARVFLAITLREEGREKDADNELKHAEWWAQVNKKEKFSQGEIPYKIGVFYLEFNCYEKAINWFSIATEKEPENFANWWRSGYAKMKLAHILKEKGFYKEAKEIFYEALFELKKAWDIAPKPLQLPASRDIPTNIEGCKRHLSM